MTYSKRSKKSGHKACINCIDGTTSNRNLIASGSEDESVRIWDIRADRAVKCIAKCFGSSVEAVKFSTLKDDTIYAASGKSLFEFDLRYEGVLIQIPVARVENKTEEDINALAVSPSGKYLAISDDAGVITIFDNEKLNTHKPKRLRGHSSLVNAISFNPNDPHGLSSGGFDYQLINWNITAPGNTFNTMVNIAKLGNSDYDEFTAKSVNPPFVQSICYVCDGVGIAVALGDGSIKVVSSAEPSHLIAAASDAHAGMATALFTSGNDTVFSGGIDRMIKCWRITDSREELEALALSESVCDLEGCDHIEHSPPIIAPETTKKKKKKSKNSRFTGNDHPMQFSLKWDEEHNEKINVIGGFMVTDATAKSHHVFVGDVSADMTMYSMEDGF